MELDSWKPFSFDGSRHFRMSHVFHMTILIVELATSVNYRVLSKLYIRIAIEYDSLSSITGGCTSILPD